MGPMWEFENKELILQMLPKVRPLVDPNSQELCAQGDLDVNRAMAFAPREL